MVVPLAVFSYTASAHARVSRDHSLAMSNLLAVAPRITCDFKMTKVMAVKASLRSLRNRDWYMFRDVIYPICVEGDAGPDANLLESCDSDARAKRSAIERSWHRAEGAGAVTLRQW